LAFRFAGVQSFERFFDMLFWKKTVMKASQDLKKNFYRRLGGPARPKEKK
jgi:hypothetical protein